MSRTFKVDKTTVDCGINPIESFLIKDFSSSERALISSLSRNIFPLVGLNIPEIIFKRVDFPLPDFPIIAINSPSSTSKLILSTALNSFALTYVLNNCSIFNILIILPHC